MTASARLDTACVHAGAIDLPVETPPLAAPIFQASVFETPTLELVVRALDAEPGHYSYSRTANPTVHAFETALAAVEGAEAAVATASGMGAISAALFAHLRPGDRLVTTPALYGTTLRLMDDLLAGVGVIVEHLPEGGALAAELPADTKVVYTETIANPLLQVADLPRLADLAHRAGAILVVDNTFATPYHCLPLAQGADLVLHSATKYIGGHSDLMAGAVAGAQDVLAPVRAAASTLGTPAAPLDAWLALRGLRTLHLRLARHAANAAAVAAHLAAHPAVEATHYPGLAASPDHAVASRVLRDGFGGMVSFALPGGRAEIGRFLARLQLIRFAASLADVATTISHPATTSHRDLTPAAREGMGIGEGLLRLSVGIEAPEDILADLDRALEG